MRINRVDHPLMPRHQLNSRLPADAFMPPAWRYSQRPLDKVIYDGLVLAEGLLTATDYTLEGFRDYRQNHDPDEAPHDLPDWLALHAAVHLENEHHGESTTCDAGPDCTERMPDGRGGTVPGYCWHDHMALCERLAELADSLRMSLRYDDYDFSNETPPFIQMIIEYVTEWTGEIFQTAIDERRCDAQVPDGWRDHIHRLLTFWLLETP